MPLVIDFHKCQTHVIKEEEVGPECQRAMKKNKWSNLVLVKNAYRKWGMCVGYINLNKACFNDPYLINNIDRFLDKYYEYQYLSFMDSYSI